MFTHRPEKLVSGRYNVVAVNGDFAAILWKDGKYFVVGKTDPQNPTEISELQAFGIDAKGQFAHPDPIPLDDISEWQKEAKKVRIPLLPLKEQTTRGH